MAATFQELLVKAQYSDDEVKDISHTIGLAVVGETIKRVEKLLPTDAVLGEDASDEVRVQHILKTAPSYLTQAEVKEIEEEVRLELTTKFYKEEILPRIRRHEDAD